jgi:hypothetical protein
MHTSKEINPGDKGKKHNNITLVAADKRAILAAPFRYNATMEHLSAFAA